MKYKLKNIWKNPIWINAKILGVNKTMIVNEKTQEIKNLEEHKYITVTPIKKK